MRVLCNLGIDELVITDGNSASKYNHHSTVIYLHNIANTVFSRRGMFPAC